MARNQTGNLCPKKNCASIITASLDYSNNFHRDQEAQNRAENGVITQEQKQKLRQLKADVERMSEEDLDENQGNLFAGISTEKIFRQLKRVKGAPILPSVLKLADQKTRQAMEKANMFNEYFISVYNPRTCGTCETENLHHLLICDFYTSPEEVCVILRGLDITKETSPDAIPPCFLQSCAEDLTKLLSFIFRNAKETGKFPSSWKIFCIKPLYNEEAKDKVANYRPVAFFILYKQNF